MPHPFVRVLGVALTVSACEKTPEPLPGNPPLPVTSDPPVVTQAPEPAPTSDLPTFDSVKSGHPEGATNPPYPLLIVTREPPACYKDWLPGMIQPPDEVMQTDGRVVDTPAQVPQGAVQVQCPPGQPQKQLDARAAYDAGRR